MTTPASRFRDIILQTLAEFPDPAPVERFYDAVAARIEFDADDLRPPIWKGSFVGEPSWKRNVRNTLQHMKQAGTLVNAARDRWRLPSPDPETALGVSGAWELVRAAAESALASERQFDSPQLGHRYRIGGVGDQRIDVIRLDASREATLTKGDVERAVRYIDAAGGRSGRRTLNYTVAKEAAIVELHPRLAWDLDTDTIVVIGGGPRRITYADFGEAPNDDPEALTLFARRVRAGQPLFRRNLLRLYGGVCAICGSGPNAVLEAAHIDPHARAGINLTSNGLLLRADLHTLFDLGLLRIEPGSLKVVLTAALLSTPYRKYDGATLRPRTDGSQPSAEFLRQRWVDSGRHQGIRLPEQHHG